MMTDPRPTEESPSLLGLVPIDTSEVKNRVLDRPFKRPSWQKSYWLWSLAGISAVTVLGVGIYGQYFVQTQIAPLIGQGLGDFLNRPVKLGKLEAVSFNSLRFGASRLEKTPQDPDQVSMAGLEIHFNPLDYLGYRQLSLEAIADSPQIYLEQGKTGEWLLTPCDRLRSDVPFQLKRLQLQKANIILVARNKQGKLKSPVPISLERADIDLRQFQSQQKVYFKLQGQLAQTGQLAIAGLYQPKEHNLNLSVRGSQLTAKAVSDLLPLPLAFTQGYLDANLDITVRQQRLTKLQGLANLENVSTELSLFPQPITAIRGPLRFQGTTVFLEQVVGQLGEGGKNQARLIAQAQGSLDLNKGYHLTLNTQPLALAQIPQALKIPTAPTSLGGKITAQLKVIGPLSQPQITAQIQNSDRRPLQIDRLGLETLTANLSLQGSNVIINHFQTHLLTGGKIQGQGRLWGTRQQGKITFSRFQGTIQAEKIALQALAHRYGKSLPQEIQQLSGQGQVTALWPQGNAHLKINQDAPFPHLRFTQARIQIPLAGGEIRGENVSYDQGHWQGHLTLNRLQIAQLPFALPTFLGQGRLQGHLQVKGYQDQLKTLEAKGQARLVVRARDNAVTTDGVSKKVVHLNQIALQGQQWQAQLQTKDLPIRSWFPQLSLSQAGRLTAQLAVGGHLGSQPLQDDLTVRGQAHIQFPQGQILAQHLKLDQGQWQAALLADQIPLRALPLTQFQALAGMVTGQVQIGGTVKDPIATLVGRGEGKFLFAQGQVRAKQVNFDAHRFEATLVSQSFGLNQLHPHLRGNLDGQVKLQGQLQRLQPQLTQVTGNLDFSQGLANLTQPLSTVFAWQGERLALQKIQTKNLSAQGNIQVDLAALNSPQNLTQRVKQVNLSLVAQGLPLTALVPKSPYLLAYGGQVNFTGSLRGNLAQPQLLGKLALENLQLGDLNFDRRLAGQIGKNHQGTHLQLQGNRDRLSLTLDSQNQPTALMLQRQGMTIQGVREQEQLFLMAKQVPLSLLQSLVGLGRPWLAKSGLEGLNQNLPALGGNLWGDLTFNFAQQSAQGKVRIEQPRLGNYGGDRLTGDFSYGQGIFSLNSGQLYSQNSRYGLQGRLNLAQNNAFQGEISLDQVSIQDLLTSLQIFRLEDLKRGLNAPVYGRAKDLYGVAVTNPQEALVSVGNPQDRANEPFKELENVNNLLRHWQERRCQRHTSCPQQSRLPDLESLQGKLAGKVEVQGTWGGEVALNFRVNGLDWHWGQFQVAEWELQGEWDRGQLSLHPLRLQSGNSLMILTGKVGGYGQEGELQLENVPLQPFASLIGLPEAVRLGGKLQAAIAIGGSRSNPKAMGKLQVDNATINQSQLQSTTGLFSYQQGRLDFAIDTVLNQKTDPLTLKGSFPYLLPFASTRSDSDRFTVGLRINNDSLKILDLLTNGELAWRGGQGTVQLDAFGRLDPQTQMVQDLQVAGLANLSQAVIAAKIFPQERLTDINGTITLDLHRLDVKNLTGKLSGGDLAISGFLNLHPSSPLPLSPSPPPSTLSLSLNNLAVKFPDLYEGGLQGKIQVGGDIQQLRIGGDLDLFKGTVLIGGQIPQLSQGQGWANQTQFQNFKLTLGEDIRIQRPLLLDFLASGGVTLNGSLSKMEPEGMISLKSGQVNLFASQLRLGGGEENAVYFHRKLDPYLNLHLISAATETNHRLASNDGRNSTNSFSLSTEIDEPFTANRDSLQTVRINANIQGYASQLDKSIQLTSTPSRSRGEIITLLGGSFINDLGQGETSLGLANFASSAVLGTVQGRIGEALGLNQFRIFSTPLINEKERTQANQLGIAAEAGIDLNDDFALSVQKIFNADRPPQWGASYRINENLRVRGSSNFLDDSRGAIEYNQRF
jgi:translocation and assembly module TamB